MTSKSKLQNPATRARMDYGFARARDLAFDAVWELWRKRQANGMKQTELAEKLGRDTGWLSRKLKGPGNWTLRTFGEMAEALDGELEIRIVPLEDQLQIKPNFDAYDAKIITTSPQPQLHNAQKRLTTPSKFFFEEE
jgi:transcriptional regulator with XRE-family HTH domain